MDAPDFRMDGRVALITGAGRGIGLGIARALASAGCAVAIQDIDLAVATAEAEKIIREGGRAAALDGDITKVDSAPRLVQQTNEQLGGFHVLVNNASIQVEKHWTQQSVEEMQTQLQADLILPMVLCQQAVGQFKSQRWGRIINIGSVQQLDGNNGMLTYSLCKAGLQLMTRALARDLAASNITVNMIAPGYFNTWRNRHELEDPQERANRGKRTVPIGRVGKPGDCGGAALLLCSEAGSYITGQTIYVDGGLSAAR